MITENETIRVIEFDIEQQIKAKAKYYYKYGDCDMEDLDAMDNIDRSISNYISIASKLGINIKYNYDNVKKMFIDEVNKLKLTHSNCMEEE